MVGSTSGRLLPSLSALTSFPEWFLLRKALSGVELGRMRLLPSRRGHPAVVLTASSSRFSADEHLLLATV